MKTAFQTLTFILILFSCGHKNEKTYDNFEVNKNLKNDTVFQYFKPNQNNNIGMNQKFLFYSRINSFSNDYKPKSKIIDDTLNIEINNYNGNFGNGILIKVFDDKYFVKSIDPNVIKGTKYEEYKLLNQNLTLNQNKFKIGDSLFGKIEFECEIPEVKTKYMKGYFKTIIE